MISGDTDKNGVINTTDLSAIETKAASFSTGYLTTDLNGDRVVEAVDYSLVENNLGYLVLHP